MGGVLILRFCCVVPGGGSTADGQADPRPLWCLLSHAAWSVRCRGFRVQYSCAKLLRLGVLRAGCVQCCTLLWRVGLQHARQDGMRHVPNAVPLLFRLSKLCESVSIKVALLKKK